MRNTTVGLLVALAFVAVPSAQTPVPAGPFDGLRFRNIGPATPSGRVDDLAVLESNPAVFYVGAATGGV